MGQELLLQVKNLRTHFYTDAGVVKAVDGVDLEIHKGETLGNGHYVACHYVN